MKFKDYIYGTEPENLPFMVDEGISDSEVYQKIVSEAGENPDDPNITICKLSENWNGHQKGSLVVTDLSIQGYRFHVREN